MIGQVNSLVGGPRWVALEIFVPYTSDRSRYTLAVVGQLSADQEPTCVGPLLTQYFLAARRIPDDEVRAVDKGVNEGAIRAYLH